jgi:hypothetical protein
MLYPALARSGLALTSGKTQQELTAACKGARPNHVEFAVSGRGAELFEHVRAIGAEGIVSKRAGSFYSGNATRDWRKTKCHAPADLSLPHSRNSGQAIPCRSRGVAGLTSPALVRSVS